MVFNFQEATTAAQPEAEPAPMAPPQASRALDQLRPGDAARVESVDAPDALAVRLADLGFCPGTPIRVVRRAPLGDPVLYELRGYRIALRRSEARHIRVRPAAP
jgi:ferrous iron transport protein A